MKKTREYAFDILRVISMCMVVIIHVSNVYSRSFTIISNKSFIVSLFFNTISRISVPIFLMISGALLLDRSFNLKKYIKRLIKFILLIIIWDLIYLLWEYYYLGTTYNKLYMLLLEPYRAHLWFLYTIVLLYAIQPLLKIILEKSNKIVKFILFIIWILLSTLSMLNSTVAQIFTVFSYIGFFVIGKYIYDYVKSKDLRKYNIPLIILMIICYSISILLNYLSSLKYNRFYNLYFAYRTPFIMFSSFAFYTLIISNYKKDNLNKIIMTLSDLSLGVYLVHGIFLDITIKELHYYKFNSLIGIPMFSILILIASILVVYIFKKLNTLSRKQSMIN